MGDNASLMYFFDATYITLLEQSSDPDSCSLLPMIVMSGPSMMRYPMYTISTYRPRPVSICGMAKNTTQRKAWLNAIPKLNTKYIVTLERKSDEIRNGDLCNEERETYWR